MSELKLPKLTKLPIFSVDATPDDDYPIRILKAYLLNTQCKWIVHGLPESDSIIYDMMNETQDKRRVILEKAISKLEAEIEKAREMVAHEST